MIINNLNDTKILFAHNSQSHPKIYVIINPQIINATFKMFNTEFKMENYKYLFINYKEIPKTTRYRLLTKFMTLNTKGY